MRARRESSVLCLVLALLAPAGVRGQDAPTIEAGAVATVAVTVPADAAASTGPITYRIDPAPGVRLFAPRVGTVERTDAEPPVLPVTFSVPGDRPAGPFTVARVTLRGPDGSATTIGLPVLVGIRRRIALSLDPVSGAAVPGEPTVLRYTVSNLGNATDTVRLRLDAAGWDVASHPDSAVVVARGDTLTGTVRIMAPERARAGDLRLVRLSLADRPDGGSASARLRAVPGPGLLPGWVHLPATVFVGTSLSGAPGTTAYDRTGLAVEAAGSVGRQTTLAVAYRHTPRSYGPVAFRRELSGPRLRIALGRPSWSALAGDVSATASALAGGFVHGRGLEARWSGERVSGDVLVGRPLGAAGGMGDGHIARVGGAYATRFGEVGASFSDLAYAPGAVGAVGRIRSAGLSYELPETDGHRVAADAGVLHLVAPSGEAVTGPAARAVYAFRGDRLALSARLRSVPAAMPGGGVASNEAYVGGSAAVREGVDLFGSAFARSTEALGRAYERRARGGKGGVRFAVRDGTVDLTANYNSTAGPGLFSQASVRRTIAARVDFPLGPIRLEGTAEAGALDVDGSDGIVQNYRGALQWTDGAGWARLGATYTEAAYGMSQVRFDLNGSWRTGRLALEGGAGMSHWLDRAAQTANFWSGVTFDLTRDLALVAGTEHQPWRAGASRFRTSFGIRRKLSLPTPIPRAPSVRGLLYEDLDGDRRRDADEPGVEGATVHLGWMETTTDAHGAFAFRDGDGGGEAPRVDATSLGAEMLVPPDVRIPSGPRVQIPVVRAATLRLRLFRDRDGDGSYDDREPAAPRARIVLSDTAQRTRHGVADGDGIAEFSALLPGRYSVTVQGVAAYGRPPAPATVEVALRPGEARILEVAVPEKRVEIRFREPSLEEEPAAVDADASPTARYTVQVGAFTNRANAERLRRRLAAEGLAVWSEDAEVDGREYRRVRIGALPTRAEADRLSAELTEQHSVPVWVTRVGQGAPPASMVTTAAGLSERSR